MIRKAKVLGFRKAKVLGNNNVSTILNKGLGLKMVDRGIDSSTPLCFPVETKAISNGSNFTPHPDSDGGAKEAMCITSAPTPGEIKPFSMTPPSSSDMETVKYSGELQ